MKNISESAIIRRINRKQKDEYLVLKKARESSRWLSTTGSYYVVNVYNNTIDSTWVNLERWARELGVLRPNETIA